MEFEKEAILRKLGISSLNKMQQESHEAFEKNTSVLLLSPTGTGKTIAYLLPVVKELLNNAASAALVIVPSRELALQIEKVAAKIATGILITACYGGRRIETEENNLRAGPVLIIGTPGRLSDHIKRGNIATGRIHFLVLDEYDKSLELGFLGEMNAIFESIPTVKKTMLVSATDAVSLPEHAFFQNLFTVNHLHAEKPLLKYFRVQSAQKDKLPALLNLLQKTGRGKTIIFSNHRESVERIQEYLENHSVFPAAYHGAMDQAKREHSLFQFRSGSSLWLNTTDLASRGLDIDDVKYIIHYHLPLSEEVFIHRNGRTARMHDNGAVVIICGPEEELPPYITEEVNFFKQPSESIAKPEWKTVFLNAGKKEKLSRTDIVGFFIKEGKLEKEAIGLIEIKDHHSFVAVKSHKAAFLLKNIKGKKIKKLALKIYL